VPHPLRAKRIRSGCRLQRASRLDDLALSNAHIQVRIIRQHTYKIQQRRRPFRSFLRTTLLFWAGSQAVVWTVRLQTLLSLSSKF
jgi:hypothetical protein